MMRRYPLLNPVLKTSKSSKVNTNVIHDEVVSSVLME